MVPTHEVSVEELAAARPQGAEVIDVRSPEEYARGHVPGAINIPIEDVLHSPERFNGESLHVICQGGGRSLRAAEAMNTAGAQAVSVSGGTSGWVESGRAVEGGADA